VSDIVRDYLRRQNYADHVVRGGLDWLVHTWEHVVASVEAGEPQYQDDYLNDMDGRRILEEALNIAPPDERSMWLPRVRAADERIRRHLVPTQECLWGDDNAVKHGYTREHDWWYYNQPDHGLGD
jgi:hypothetical protein